MPQRRKMEMSSGWMDEPHMEAREFLGDSRRGEAGLNGKTIPARFQTLIPVQIHVFRSPGELNLKESYVRFFLFKSPLGCFASLIALTQRWSSLNPARDVSPFDTRRLVAQEVMRFLLFFFFLNKQEKKNLVVTIGSDSHHDWPHKKKRNSNSNSRPRFLIDRWVHKLCVLKQCFSKCGPGTSTGPCGASSRSKMTNNLISLKL